MDSPFFYTDIVTGPAFIGREKEVSLFCDHIRSKRNILLYGPARIGKRSLIQNALNRLSAESYRYTLFKVNLFNIRCIEAFLLRYTNILFSYFATSSMEWNTMLKKYLPQAPYELDENSGKPQLTYTTKELLTNEQIVELINLPDRLAKESQTNILIYFEQFQDISLFDDAHRFFKLFEKCMQEHTRTSYIITGERKNAMDEIFEKDKYFYRQTEKIDLKPINRKTFADFIVKGFLKAGKVIQPEQAETIYNAVEGDPWYTQHLADICYNMTQGYMSDKIIPKALQSLINLHDFLFHSIAYGLSKHQLRFIKALLEGVTKFSSADILDRYNLNSSANVNRIKEALTKKEILTANENKEMVFIDPLFKLWFAKYFFIK
ncbi:MAG: ATP-binding protein [Bacteroidales bacterium]|nr:ATP-binding protein [Bacteroidales bacterium]